jgi:MFS family permease
VTASGTAQPSTESAQRAENQRRTVAVLSATQIIGGIGAGAAVSVGALLAEDVSGSAAWSGMAATLTTLGAAIAAVPLSRLAERRGRRPALTSGWVLAAVGSALAVVAAAVPSFPLLMLGLTLMGFGTASALQARFAATDLAGPGERARALSLVVWASTVGSVAGPNLTRPGASVAEAVGVPALAGPLLFSCAAAIISALILTIALRPDPLVLARRSLETPAPSSAVAATPEAPSGQLETSPRAGAPRAISIIAASPAARAGLLAVVTGHAVMVSVMAMTPVHMRGHGAGLTVIGLTISLHIAGMFAFSPVVGWIADRYGRRPALLAGFGLLIVATLTTAAAGSSTLLVTVGLIALGLGWSFVTIAGSAQLSEAIPLSQRPRVQGTADLLMNLAGAAAGGLSGVVVAQLDYTGLSLAAALLILPALLLAGFRPIRN